VRPRSDGDSPELGWGGELRGPRVGFYRREREDSCLGMSYWGGHNWGRGYLAVAGEARRRTSGARGWRMPPHGGFLRGKSEILWASGRFSKC
jgi:hypothetical protein